MVEPGAVLDVLALFNAFSGRPPLDYGGSAVLALGDFARELDAFAYAEPLAITRVDSGAGRRYLVRDPEAARRLVRGFLVGASLGIQERVRLLEAERRRG